MQVVVSEIIQVTGAMRRNQRWSIENPLDASALSQEDYFQEVSFRESSGLEYIKEFTHFKASKSTKDLLVSFSSLKARLGVTQSCQD